MIYSLKDSKPELLKQLEGLDLKQSLSVLAAQFSGKVTFSSSFGLEDQVITHLIASHRIPISIFTLDTGRLFPETYSLWSRTMKQYKILIKAYFPDATGLEKYLNEKGPNAFYESVNNRMECCRIRKVEPLKRALKGNSIWITGLRAEHSSSRQQLEPIEWDEVHQVIKFHPLLHWTTEEVWQFIRENNIPYNPLHDKGFVSIGCGPCTRAILPGEDFRAGRWWWEDRSKKECGLHERATQATN